MKVLIGQPVGSEGQAHCFSVRAACIGHGIHGNVKYLPHGSSLLAKNFNALWGEGISGGYDYFIMLHSDIVPEDGWGQKLIDLIETHQADTVSVAMPIKSDKGWTSCGIGDHCNKWSPLFRFTMKQLAKLPGTFTPDDIGWRNYPLVWNTGCWIADVRKPWCFRTNHAGELLARFQVNDRIRFNKETGKLTVQGESEDWYFSRILYDLGCKCMVTREIKARHYGLHNWPNWDVWGDDQDELASRAHVQAESRRVRMEYGIHDHGYWTDTSAEGHLFDDDLAEAITVVAQETGSTVWDFGCGMGAYSKRMRDAGLDVLAVDGNPNTPQMTDGIGAVQDLAVPFNGKPSDMVLCLEVGEHIPKQYEDELFDNIERHCNKRAIVSWAVPNQVGRGHVNCKPNHQVVASMRSRGFRHNIPAERALRDCATLGYFKDTLMVFDRETNK